MVYGKQHVNRKRLATCWWIGVKKGYVIQANQVRFGDRIRGHGGRKRGLPVFLLEQGYGFEVLE